MVKNSGVLLSRTVTRRCVFLMRALSFALSLSDGDTHVKEQAKIDVDWATQEMGHQAGSGVGQEWASLIWSQTPQVREG